MKSLKPRAWLKTKKRMVGTDDLLVIDYDLTQIMTQQVFFERGLAVERDIKYYDFEDIELMQSTGLFDKKGVEIFEGDIVKRYKSPFFKAEWEYQIETVIKGKASLLLGRKYGKNFGTISFDSPFAKSELLEVIGNIYENANLLGKEESDKGTITELLVKGTYDKKSERWYIDTDGATVEEMNSFLKEHDLDVFESWLGYLEGGMSDESLAFINILQTIENEIELADGSKIKLVEG